MLLCSSVTSSRKPPGIPVLRVPFLSPPHLSLDLLFPFAGSCLFYWQKQGAREWDLLCSPPSQPEAESSECKQVLSTGMCGLDT